MTWVYNGRTAVSRNAPATPMMTPLSNGIPLTEPAMPKTTNPAIIDESDLWSLRIGTESKTLLILGTKKGAIKLALMTAITLSSRKAPLIFVAMLLTLGIPIMQILS